MKTILFFILFGSGSFYGLAQDTLSTEMAVWFVKESLYDHDIHSIRKTVIFHDSDNYYLKQCKALQDSGLVKLTPIDSVYIDAQPSHQVLKIEYLQTSEKLREFTFFNVEKGTVEFLLYSYDSIDIVSIKLVNNVYEIRFRVINPQPTFFYNVHYIGEDAREDSFEAIRYVKFTEDSWEIDRYPFRN